MTCLLGSATIRFSYRERILPEKKRIALVEDHALLRGVLAIRLNLEPDFEVTALCSSLADTKEFDFQQWDAAIVHIFLPDGDGMELIRELNASIPRSIPAIALTSSSNPEVHEKARNAGANEVLTKRVGFDGIIDALRRILRDE